MEIATPWSDMDALPISGTSMDAAFSVNDNDGPGTAKQETMLSNVFPSLQDPTKCWRTVTLE
jgi:hypothetical protein